MEPRIGDLVRYWIDPTILRHRRRLQGKIGIVKDNNGYNLLLVDFIEFGEEWIDISDLILLNRPVQNKADLPAANSQLNKSRNKV